jgi:hypothetical protein
MTAPMPPFICWEADDALESLHAAGLPIENVTPAQWPPDAPQPRTHRQALTFVGPEVTDPHLLLVFDTPEALETWRLWLARYVKARPYLHVKDNLLLLVSRDVPPEQARVYHAALDRVRAT